MALPFLTLLLTVLFTLPSAQASDRTFSVRQIYQFPNDTYSDIENVAARPNGDLLFTMITEPSVYLFDPSAANPQPRRIHQFENATSTTGITEIAPDIFAVVSGSLKGFQGVTGSFIIWTLDLNHDEPVVKQLAALEDAHGLNALTTITVGSLKSVLAADSTLGAIWKIDVSTSDYNITFEDPYFSPNATFPIGVNGIHVVGEKLYFSASAQRAFGYFLISTNGEIIENATIIAEPSPGGTYDDFVIDKHGQVFLTQHPDSLIVIDLATGEQQRLTNPDGVNIVGPTSLIAARGGPKADCIVYLVTGGSNDGQGHFVSGQVIEIQSS